MARFYGFENANLIKAPYVLIDGEEYEVQPAEYEGNPLTAGQLNEMQDNVDAAKFDKTIDITTAGEDLNDYVEDGVYYFSSSVTPTNIPEGVNGWLRVIKGNQNTSVKQIWYRQGTRDVNDNDTYIRTLHDNVTWSSWEKYITSSHYKLQSNEPFSKGLPNGGYLIIITRTNGSTSAGLYIVNIGNNSYLTTIVPYSMGNLELNNKTISITTTAVTEFTISKLY